jgi:WD40 repeat protein
MRYYAGLIVLATSLAVATQPLTVAREAHFCGHSAVVNAAAMNRSGTRVASGDGDGNIIVWDARGSGGRGLRRWLIAQDGVSALEFIDDDTIWAGFRSGAVRLYRTDTGDLMSQWNAGGWVTDTMLSPDGRSIALQTRSPQGEYGSERLSVFDTRSGVRLGVSNLRGPPSGAPGALERQLAFTPDSATLILAVGGTVRAYDLQSGAPRWQWQAETARDGDDTDPRAQVSIALSPDGTIVATGSRGGLRLLDASSGDVKLTISTDWALGALRFSDDGTRLFSSPTRHPLLQPVDGLTQVWDVASGTRTLSVDGTRVLEATDETITTLWDAALLRWDAKSGAEVGGQRLPQGIGRSVPGGVLIWGEGPLRLARVDGSPPLEFAGLSANDLTLSPDGHFIALSAVDGTVRLLQTSSFQEVRRFAVAVKTRDEYVDTFFQAAFSPDGTMIAAGNANNRVYVWNLETGTLVARLSGFAADEGQRNLQDWRRGFSDPGLRGFARSLSWSPDGKTLAVGYEARNIGLWDTTTWRVRARLRGHRGWVLALAWRADGKQLLSGAGDGTVRFWDVNTGSSQTRPVNTRFVRAVAYSPDGTRAASASGDGSVILWEAARATPIKRLEGHADAATSLAWSADSTQLISGSSDQTFRVWDARTGSSLERVTGSETAILALALGDDGKTLYSLSKDSTVRAWSRADGANVIGGAR